MLGEGVWAGISGHRHKTIYSELNDADDVREEFSAISGPIEKADPVRLGQETIEIREIGFAERSLGGFDFRWGNDDIELDSDRANDL